MRWWLDEAPPSLGNAVVSEERCTAGVINPATSASVEYAFDQLVALAVVTNTNPGKVLSIQGHCPWDHTMTACELSGQT